jgi:hypothetical protein
MPKTIIGADGRLYSILGNKVDVSTQSLSHNSVAVKGAVEMSDMDNSSVHITY